MAHSISDAISDSGQRGVPAPGRQQWHQDADLALQQGGHGAALLLAAPSQLGEGDGVERAHGDGVADTEAGQAGPQLAGSLAGEGEGEHVRRIDELLARLPRDAAGEDARLARAGAGEDRQRHRRGW